MTIDEKRELAEEIRAENKWVNEAQLLIFIDALSEYLDAKDKIEKTGAVLLKDGKPIENPWLIVRDRAAKTLAASRIKTKRSLL